MFKTSLVYMINSKYIIFAPDQFFFERFFSIGLKMSYLKIGQYSIVVFDASFSKYFDFRFNFRFDFSGVDFRLKFSSFRKKYCESQFVMHKLCSITKLSNIHQIPVFRARQFHSTRTLPFLFWCGFKRESFSCAFEYLSVLIKFWNSICVQWQFIYSFINIFE